MVLVIAMICWTLGSVYLIARNERVNTRLSVRLGEGEHEIFAALPAGGYHISFTSTPNVSVVGSSSPVPRIPAKITTALLRADSDVAVLEPTHEEHMKFSIPKKDEFRPHRLRVTVARNQPCQIYMKLSPGK